MSLRGESIYFVIFLLYPKGKISLFIYFFLVCIITEQLSLIETMLIQTTTDIHNTMS